MIQKTVLKQYGKVEKCRLYMNNLPLYQATIDELDGKEVELNLKEKEQNPTMKQFGYYHAVIIPAALSDEQFGGWTHDELDSYLTKDHLGKMVMKELNGIPIEFRKTPSKSGISKKAMSEFTNRCIQFLNQLGIDIPESEKQATKHYADTGGFKSRR